MDKLKRKRLILIFGIMFTIIMGLSSSYAFFTYNKSGNQISLASGEISIDFANNSNYVNLSDAYPVTDDIGKIYPYYNDFTVSGVSTLKGIEYHIAILPDSSNTLSSEYIKIYLTDQDDNQLLVPSLLSELTDFSENNVSGKELYSGVMKTATNDFRLRVWIDENYTNTQTQTFNFQIYLYAYNVDFEIYGIKRNMSSNSTAWERIEDSVAKVATAQVGTASVRNDFDSIYPWSDIKSYNYNPSTKTITAWYGEEGFNLDGSNGEVLTFIPEFYYKREQVDGYEYVYISRNYLNGYTKSEAFSVGRYLMSYDSTAHSKTWSYVMTGMTIGDARRYAEALGDGFSQMDYHYFILQMLYLVEYADYDAQSKLGNGATMFRINVFQDRSLLTETDVNRIVIPNSGYRVGQQLDIATNTYARDVSCNRTIMAINEYDDGTVSGYEIVLDSWGATFNTVAGKTLIYPSPQNTGSTDSLGMKSGTMVNDGMHGVSYRGIEDIFGNVDQFVDGINSKSENVQIDGYDGLQNVNKIYVNYNYKTFENNKYDEDYRLIAGNYGVGISGSGYIKQFYYDASNPLIGFPSAMVETSQYSTSLKDYANILSFGTIAYIGGTVRGNTFAGMWSWYFYGNESFTNIYLGARILLH